MTKHLIISFLFLLISTGQILSQDAEKGHAFKVYSNVLIENQERSFDFDPNDSLRLFLNINDYQIGYFSPAFNFIRGNGDIHEIEFSRLAFGRIFADTLTIFEDPDITSTLRQGPALNRFQIAFRYEYQWLINKANTGSKWKAYLGFAGEPFLRYLVYEPALTTEFSFSLLDIGINISVIPRLSYFLNDRWFLDLNIPLAVYQLNFQQEVNDNPTIPLNESRTNSFVVEAFPSIFQIRFGGGIRF